jgi:hypothetical protein
MANGLSNNDYGLELGATYKGLTFKGKIFEGICMGELSSFVTLQNKNGIQRDCHINTIVKIKGA